MLDPDRRKKMISLRLSEEEYELLKASYHTYGARNVSELARQALQHIMTGSPFPQHDFAAELAELDSRVHALDSSSTVGDARWPQLIDSTRVDVCQREILVSRLICK